MRIVDYLLLALELGLLQTKALGLHRRPAKGHVADQVIVCELLGSGEVCLNRDLFVEKHTGMTTGPLCVHLQRIAATKAKIIYLF